MERFGSTVWLIAAVLLFSAGLGLKVLMGPDATPPRSEQLAKLATHVVETGRRFGLVVHDQRTLTNEGAYKSLILARAGCQGAAAIIPLYRNGEASGLLKQLATDGAEILYLNQGAFSAAFPGFAFWLSRAKTRIDRMLGQESLPRLLGIAEWGTCGITAALSASLEP